ncbi:MAG: hypothetical protein WA705_06950 [Candidatus Ozemobacteraceae bacterium]
MFSRHWFSRRGSIVIILIGLISVMLLLLFSLSRRMSGHTQLLTIVDATQIARYFLESYAGDVLRQARKQINSRKPGEPENDLYKAFREVGTGDKDLSTLPFTPSSLLEKLRGDLDIKLIGKPIIKITGREALEYPEMLQIGATQKGREKRGFFAISCTIEFQKRRYTLAVRHPFRVVYRLQPMLREFVLFFDQIHLEQRTPFAADDRLNILYLKDNAFSEKGRPWVLSSKPEDDPKVENNGRVYFGDSSHNIHLNIAGEESFRTGLFNDLWQISPRSFAANTTNASFVNQPLFLKTDGVNQVSLRGMEIPLSFRGHLAKMGILGFCGDLTDSSDGLFSGSNRKLQDFLGADPAFTKIAGGDPRPLGLTTSFKLRGLNMEPLMDQAGSTGSGKEYFGPVRQIFGNVFARFMLITFFDFPSAQGGGGPLEYNSDPGHQPTYTQWGTYNQVKFEPKDGDYRHYMSQFVSGGNEPGEFRVPLNQPPGAPPKVFTHADFSPTDGLKVTKPFDQFCSQWLQIDKKKSINAVKSIQSRISAYFPDQNAFENGVGMKANPPRLWIDGVIFIDSALNMPNGIPSNVDVHGGTILVNGPITLGDIPGGWTDFTSPQYNKRAVDRMNLTQDTFLTFISLTGPIVLTGDHHVGVQLVCLKPGLPGPSDMIKWSKGDNVVFYGGVAVSTPNMKERVQDFKSPPEMLYVPAMADANPALAVTLPMTMGSYRLTVN